VRFDEKLKMEDPEYTLELNVKDAVTAILMENAKALAKGESVNEKNFLIGTSDSQEEFNLKLSDISEKFLELQGCNDITTNKKIGVSRRVKKLFELRLGFSVAIGPSRSRIVAIPVKWVTNGDSKEPLAKDHSKDSQVQHSSMPQLMTREVCTS
jgi:hypothetical protein